MLPGLLETHHYLLVRPNTELSPLLAAYLATGITTVIFTGDYFPAIVDMRQRLEDGELQGRPLLVSDPVLTHPKDTQR